MIWCFNVQLDILCSLSSFIFLLTAVKDLNDSKHVLLFWND